MLEYYVSRLTGTNESATCYVFKNEGAYQKIEKKSPWIRKKNPHKEQALCPS